MPVGEDTGHRSFPSAEELKRRMEQGIPNMEVLIQVILCQNLK